MTNKINVGADEMLVNAVNQMNRRSQRYVFLDQSLEKDWGQITLLTRDKSDLTPKLYIRAAITQLDQGVVSDSGSIGLDFTNAPNPWSPFNFNLKDSTVSAGRDVSVVTVDMHLVSYPDKTIIPGSSVANTMVVTSDSRSGQVNGLIKLTGLDFSIKLNRIESTGQAIRNLIELGTIELLGNHAHVPYWQCLNIRTSNQKLDNLDQARFMATPRPSRIRAIQEMLTTLGYLNDVKDGVIGQRTRAAISRFQADAKLIATGEVNYQLFTLLKEKTTGFNPDRRPLPNKPAPKNTPSISLFPNRQTYRKGDILKLGLTVGKDGFVQCFHQSGKGRIVQILPLSPGNFMPVHSGAVVQIPGKTANFDIKFEKSGEEEAVLCLLSQNTQYTPPATIAKGVLKPIPSQSFDDIARNYRRRNIPFSTAQFRMKARN